MCSTYFSALQQIRSRKFVELMDRVPRNPRGHPRHSIAGTFLVDLRDLMKFRQRARFLVRNLQLQNVAARELARANRIHQLLNSTAGERGNVEPVLSRLEPPERRLYIILFV